MIRMTTILLAGCLAAGCISTDAVYPVTWAGRMKLDSNQCPSIDGEYSNVGGHVPGAGPRRLFRNGRHREPRGHPRRSGRGPATAQFRVRGCDDGRAPLRQPAGGRRDALRHGAARNGSSRTLELPIGKRCDGSMLDAGAGWKGNTILLASEVDRSSMKLGRAEDGALLIRTNQSMGWFITYVPVFATQDARWIRFPAIGRGPARERRFRVGRAITPCLRDPMLS